MLTSQVCQKLPSSKNKTPEQVYVITGNKNAKMTPGNFFLFFSMNL
jgi:hypothetical protein